MVIPGTALPKISSICSHWVSKHINTPIRPTSSKPVIRTPKLKVRPLNDIILVSRRAGSPLLRALIRILRGRRRRINLLVLVFERIWVAELLRSPRLVLF